MKRKHRNLDGKSQSEGSEEPVLKSDRNTELIEFEQIEGIVSRCISVNEIESQDGNKHQDASCHGVEKEFDGGVDSPLRVPPDPDQEIHRN